MLSGSSIGHGIVRILWETQTCTDAARIRKAASLLERSVSTATRRKGGESINEKMRSALTTHDRPSRSFQRRPRGGHGEIAWSRARRTSRPALGSRIREVLRCRGIPGHNHFRLRQRVRLLESDTARSRRRTRWIIANVGVARRTRKGFVGGLNSSTNVRERKKYLINSRAACGFFFNAASRVAVDILRELKLQSLTSSFS